MPSEFFLFGVPIAGRDRHAGMTPDRVGPRQCGDEHLAGGLIRLAASAWPPPTQLKQIVDLLPPVGLRSSRRLHRQPELLA
jgi:hypothetical protein